MVTICSFHINVLHSLKLHFYCVFILKLVITVTASKFLNCQWFVESHLIGLRKFFCTTFREILVMRNGKYFLHEAEPTWDEIEMNIQNSRKTQNCSLTLGVNLWSTVMVSAVLDAKKSHKITQNDWHDLQQKRNSTEFWLIFNLKMLIITLDGSHYKNNKKYCHDSSTFGNIWLTSNLTNNMISDQRWPPKFPWPKLEF